MCLLNKNWAKDIVVCIDMRKVACRILDYVILYMLHSMRQSDCQDSSKINVKDIVEFIYSAQNSNDSQLFILVLIKNPSTLH